MNKKYIVQLTAEQRAALEQRIRAGSCAAAIQRHARILLKADTSADGPAWSDVAIAAAERQRINRALGRLPETQRQIVELRAAGMRGAEIAQLLNMTIGAVKTANHRAYSRLRELLDEDGSKQDLSS